MADVSQYFAIGPPAAAVAVLFEAEEVRLEPVPIAVQKQLHVYHTPGLQRGGGDWPGRGSEVQARVLSLPRAYNNVLSLHPSGIYICQFKYTTALSLVVKVYLTVRKFTTS